MGKIWQWMVGGAVLTGGLGSLIYNMVHKDKKKTYTNLNHCKVPAEWEPIRNRAWEKAKTVLSKAGLNPITMCKEIKIEAGIKVNPTTGQWGRPTSNGFWYAGLSSTTRIQIVATPEKKPYSRSEPILAHEAGESILNLDPTWSKKTADERNKFLWSLGL